jgi:murein DD-endopeptidase MepM/ murein hydrolase activator NlpD
MRGLNLHASQVTLPMWAVVLGVLMVLGGAGAVGWWLGQSERLEGRMAALTLEAKRLQTELQAEQSRNQVYSVEAEQMQQTLRVMEAELNRLRLKAKLPKIQLVPPASSRPPKSELPGDSIEFAKGGAGMELGDLLLSLRSQAGSFAAEFESTDTALERPLADAANRPVVYRSHNRPAAPQEYRPLSPGVKPVVPVDSYVPQLPPEPVPLQYQALPSGLPLTVRSEITSSFGYRGNPFGGYSSEFHNGLDLAARLGTPIYNTAPGWVEEAGWNRIFGLMVLIDHNNGYRTLYGHMSELGVEAGQQLDYGSFIGRVGSTGRSTGPHLHYSVFRYGVAVDPAPYLR